ncbi:MAG: RecX family transcriptional regulator [Clostridiales bacterium]|nr:RecX family transcriptional regulator [Clostridiales bacterium]
MAHIVSVRKSFARYTVEFDDGSAMFVRAKDIKKLNLGPGTEVDADELVKLLRPLQLDDAYEDALTILDYSMKTSRQMRDKLRAKGYLDDVTDAVVQRLEASKLLDDEYVARMLMENMTASGRGKLALRQKLRQKGISEEIEQSVMEDVSGEDQDAACLEAARKLFRKYASLEPREQKQKLSRALASRGFGWDSVSYAIEKLIRESED